MTSLKRQPRGIFRLFEKQNGEGVLPRCVHSHATFHRQGLEETLTLHRLDLFEELGRHLKTTNGIENFMGQVSWRIGKVQRWHHSPQRHQWMALAILEAESRMRRITGYEDLPKLKRALKDAIPDRD
ncbi:hypothetical protein [Salinibacter ruber]|uniref:hypothetical protein n=1 Tax=Salinibacter ruber TaxID=146919 RepID=UPI00216A33D9|nr:hypothetical protein [Salinibacter ruber]MCS4223599.1 hypothetical protein [Salinibacter ruber]